MRIMLPNQEFVDALKAAQEIGARMMVSQSTNSRAHGMAMGNLETAQLWAQSDGEEKNRTGTVSTEVASETN